MTDSSLSERSGLERGVRDRLLDAAERLFCAKGFHGTSVRDLTTEANCNVAAINYHFGGKVELYSEMFRRQIKLVIEESMAVIDRVMSSPHPSIEALIRGWVTAPLKAVELNEPRGLVLQLMVREVLNRQVDPERIFADLKEVFVARMSAAFRELGEGLNVRNSQLAVFSVDALMLHPLLFMPYYRSWIEGCDSDKIIDHVVRFGAAAIRGYRGNQA